MAENLVGFLHECAESYGSKTALLIKPGFRYRTWSYDDLWEASGRVAALLQSRGVQKGDRTVIWGPNSPMWVMAFFGSMRAGAIPVPIDLRSDEGFAARIAEKARPSLAFASRFAPNAGVSLGIDLVSLEELEDLIADAGEPAPVEIAPDDVAELMFTSGTTGDPKGVMLTHRNILSDLEAVRQYIPGKPYYRLVSLLPLSHMFEQMGGLYLAFACGADVTYVTSLQPAKIMETMKDRKVVTMLLVPQVLSLFMKGIEAEVERKGKQRLWNAMHSVASRLPMRLRRLVFFQVHKKLGGSLEFFTAGGAALDPDVARKWTNMGVTVLQGYGATETAPVIAVHPLSEPRFDSVGKPVPGVDVKIVEDGEVWVKGANVTPGYWEAPEQTSSVFEGEWYKTGDIGFFDEEGFLHLSGRKKDMIVLANGQNVFPDDIERVLNEHPSVSTSAVVGLERGEKVEVHAVLVMLDDGDPAEAVRWANGKLGSHQHIGGHTVWPGEDLPRTHTLKIKKHEVLKALEEGFDDAPNEEPEAPAPSGEASIDQLLAECARVPAADLNEAQTLGGDLNLDSLARVVLLSDVEERLHVYLDDSAVTGDTTVGELRAMVSNAANVPPRMNFPRWGRRAWARAVRGSVQRSLVFPALTWAYGIETTGREHLERIKGPILIAANHTLHLDNGVLLKALPGHIRSRLAIAASSHMFNNRVQSWLIPLLGNGFPFAKEGPVRASLDNLGRVLDDGWSVLLYPEGELTVGGPMKPFKPGVGLIATQSHVPVVPLRLEVDRFGFPSYAPFLWRGSLRVHIGEPIHFENGTTSEQAAQTIEQAVASLGSDEPLFSV